MSLVESDDFGAFSAQPAALGTEEAQVEEAAVDSSGGMDDGFEGFSNFQATTEGQPAQLEDDFGTFTSPEATSDFQAFATPTSQLSPPAEGQVKSTDDDFGDFGDGAASFEQPQQPQQQQEELQSEKVKQEIPLFKEFGIDYYGYLDRIYSNAQSDETFTSFLSTHLRMENTHETEETSQPIFLNDPVTAKLILNPIYADTEWHKFLQQATTTQQDDSADTSSRYRWRKSCIRKNTLQSLNINISLEDVFPIVSLDPDSKASPDTRRRTLRKSLSSSDLILNNDGSPDMAKNSLAVNEKETFDERNLSDGNPVFDSDLAKQLVTLSTDHLYTLSAQELKNVKNDLVYTIREANSMQKYLQEQKNRLSEAIGMNNKMIEGLVARATAARNNSSPAGRPSSPLKWMG